MKSHKFASLVLTTLFFALPAAAVEAEKAPPRSEQIVTIDAGREESFQVQTPSEVEEDVQTRFERGRSRLEQKFDKPDRRDDLEQSLLIRKF